MIAQISASKCRALRGILVFIQPLASQNAFMVDATFAWTPVKMPTSIPQLVSAHELASKSFPPIDFVVAGLIPKGLTVLAGEPKAGKSWLSLDIALSIARGVGCLGERHCKQGDVLYLALEDDEARLQWRIRQILGDEAAWPRCLMLPTEWPRLDAGGIEALEAWMVAQSSPRAIIIDVYERFRSRSRRAAGSYQSEYDELNLLQALARRRDVAIILVHHLRKGAGRGDPYQRVMGSTGFVGAVDTVIVLDRGRTMTRLLARGRDIAEVDDVVAFDDQAMVWRPTYVQAPVSLFPERDRIVQLLAEKGLPMKPSDVAASLGLKPASVRTTLRRMDLAGEVIRSSYGAYVLPRALPIDHAA